MKYPALLLIVLFIIQQSLSQTYNISADYSTIDGFSLQKNQFGVSYVNPNSTHIENNNQLRILNN